MKLPIIASLLLLMSSAAWSQTQVNTDRFPKSWQMCITYGERTGGLAIPEGDCNGRELRTQDAKLNQAYKMVITRLTPQRKADLRTDERNWIAARDKNCFSREEDEKGECLISETMKRVSYLERYR